jgi:hypothetical protein
MIPEWLPPLIIGVLLVIVTPGLAIAGLLYVVISVRQLKDGQNYIAWRLGMGPAPRQRRGVVVPGPWRRSG